MWGLLCSSFSLLYFGVALVVFSCTVVLVGTTRSGRGESVMFKLYSVLYTGEVNWGYCYRGVMIMLSKVFFIACLWVTVMVSFL